MIMIMFTVICDITVFNDCCLAANMRVAEKGAEDSSEGNSNSPRVLWEPS